MRKLHLVLLATTLSQACTHEYPYIWVQELREDTSEVTVQPGDTLTVLVKNQAQLSGDFVVRPNGSYLQPLVGEVPAAGITTKQLTENLTQRLTNIITDPIVSI